MWLFGPCPKKESPTYDSIKLRCDCSSKVTNSVAIVIFPIARCPVAGGGWLVRPGTAWIFAGCGSPGRGERAGQVCAMCATSAGPTAARQTTQKTNQTRWLYRANYFILFCGAPRPGYHSQIYYLFDLSHHLGVLLSYLLMRLARNAQTIRT